MHCDVSIELIVSNLCKTVALHLKYLHFWLRPLTMGWVWAIRFSKLFELFWLKKETVKTWQVVCYDMETTLTKVK